MKTLKDKKPLDKLYRRRNRYDLQPEFQRRKVWNEKMEKKLLDTILREWDIPKIYLNQLEQDNFEVVDGQQRLSCIYKFYDNDISLSEEVSEEYGGLYYNELPDKIKDIFDDYEIDLVILEDADDHELRELFARLQLGKPLNTGEKLNAIPGKMRDFATHLTQHEFFTSRISLKNTRFSHLSVCGQLCILAVKGIDNHKFADIERFFKSNANFDAKTEDGRRIERLLDYLCQIFSEDNRIFRNRASITTIFTVLKDLDNSGFNFTRENREKIRIFYESFDNRLRRVVEKGAEADDLDLVLYQSKVTQGADNKTSLTLRRSILKLLMLEYDDAFKQYFNLSPSEIDLAEYRKKETIKELQDSCLTLITDINKITQPKEKVDVFKMTTEVMSSALILAKPLESESDFKNFIDALYKIVYESSGSLKRVPDELLQAESVYFDIKHLRTDMFHDVEHGKESKIRNKQQVISQIYNKYTKRSSLKEISNSDLIRFQRELLKSLDLELQTLKNHVSK